MLGLLVQIIKRLKGLQPGLPCSDLNSSYQRVLGKMYSRLQNRLRPSALQKKFVSTDHLAQF
jgi:hypothetical protein